MKKFLMYIWQAPQMLAALIWYLIRHKDITEKITGTFYTVYRGTNAGGMTLGDKVFLGNNYRGEYLQLIIAHESGHVLQSKYLGPLYLLIIGIPSLLWAWLHKTIAPSKSYWSFYTEKWANDLGGVAVNDQGILTWKHLIK